MSTYKNTSGDLTLTGDGGLATLTINYANTIFNGSLTYTGNSTTVDDFIVVAANNTGAITEMGLLGQTGPTTFAGLRFNSVANACRSATVYQVRVRLLPVMPILLPLSVQLLLPEQTLKYNLTTAEHLEQLQT